MDLRALGGDAPGTAPIAVGAMRLSERGRPPEGEALQVLAAALDAGANLIDTADTYGLGESDGGHNERLIARLLKERDRRGRPLVATKGGMVWRDGAWVANGRPAYLRAACEASLRALAVEAIDLYQLHGPDPTVPLGESVGALDELRREGKIRHLGVCNVSPDQLRRAAAAAPLASVQARLSPLDLGPLRTGLVELARTLGLLFFAAAPLGGLAGCAELVQRRALNAVGRGHGVSPCRVALAWLAQRGQVVPLPGPTRIRTAVDAVAAARLVLSLEELRQLDRAFGG